MAKDMTTGNPLKLILLFSIPVLLGNIFQQFYNMVDTIIVGRFLGEDALAAVGSTGSIVFLVLGFAMGIAQGFGVMISHAFGARDERRLKHYVAVSLILGFLISAVITVITVVCSRQLLLFMKTPENILSMANAGPNTGGSQFFITLAPTPWLNGHHAIFGKIVEGMEVVRLIGVVPTDFRDRPREAVIMEKVEVVK